MGALVALPLAPQSSNLACPRCGSEWWDTAVVLDARDRSTAGYSLSLARCHDCALPLDHV